MSQDLDFLVFIGRFQPFHNGHLAVIEQALAQSRFVVVLCGSAHLPRTIRNPWTFREREAMIKGAIAPSEHERLLIAPLMDVPYNDELWIKGVQETVTGFIRAHYRTPHKPPKVALIGHAKDHSSYYIRLFPQWGAVRVENFVGLNATDIRHAVFEVNGRYADIKTAKPALLPEHVVDFLDAFVCTDDYARVKAEYDYVHQYMAQWEATPFPVTFVTVDAVVIQSGHVLMIRRRHFPGKGLMALPGGFVDPGETLKQAVLRELKEETRINVPRKVLNGNIKASEVFDEPHRSSRGRTVTQAFLIELAPGDELPKVRGGDDAKDAFWIPLADLDPAEIFEDHYAIIQKMLGVL